MNGIAKPIASEDPLSYLPRTLVREFSHGGVIYDFDSPNTQVHLVISGYVIIARLTGDTEVIMDLCQADEFFGESSLVHAISGERATAIGPTRVMSWAAPTVSGLMLRQPGLGLAFTQLLACRCISLEGRITALSADTAPRRLAKALLYLAERMGQPDPTQPEMRNIPPLSHQLLAQYIGSTRAVVTHALIQFRRDHLIRYTRQKISVDFAALRNWLGEYVPLPGACQPSQAQDNNEA